MCDRFKTKRSLRVHCPNQSENKCEICARDFCTLTKLNAHKESCKRSVGHDTNIVGCGPTTAIVSKSSQCNASPIKVELNETTANFNRETSIANESDNETVEPLTVAVLSQTSYVAVDSIDGAIQNFKLNRAPGPFECDVCGRLFNKKCNMKVHRITHTDERAFECWLCRKTYVAFWLSNIFFLNFICAKILPFSDLG